MKEFGEKYYEKSAYINFDDNERMKKLFEGDFDLKKIIQGLKIEAGVNIEPHNTLIILDEIQETPKALKYFCENAREYHIVSAGSLLGVALHSGTSFPVGKVDFLDLSPLGKDNVPIEVKANENLQAKSLKAFVQKYNTKINVRTSMSRYRKDDWITNIPLYNIGNIKEIVCIE